MQQLRVTQRVKPVEVLQCCFLLKCAAAESYTESYTCRGFTMLFLLKCAAAEGFVVFCTDCSLWSPLSAGQPLLTDAGLFKMPAAK